jgi:calcineurin-like phosphoesterase family protein
MPNIWFISDTHFGHKNILEYEKEARPFSTIVEMNEYIIQCWNNVVRQNDVIFHLGDFAFGNQNIKIAERLNGRKRLILGNHDTYDSHVYLQYFEKLYGMKFWDKCILSHMPVHPNQLGSRVFLNIHGHLHSRKVHAKSALNLTYEDRSYFNVSCEQNNLTPFHADIIRDRLKEIE